MHSIHVLSFAALLSIALASSGLAADKAPPAKPGADDSKADEKCEHGVKRTICTRCNPKLKPVFKAKGDWCAEHDRPETQCAICHPDLEKKGVKK